MLNSKAHNSLRTGKKSYSDDESFFSKIELEILSFITAIQFIVILTKNVFHNGKHVEMYLLS